MAIPQPYESRFQCQICGVDVVPNGPPEGGWDHDGDVETPHEAVPDPRLLAEMDTLEEIAAALEDVARKLFYAGFKTGDWRILCRRAWAAAKP